VAKELQEVNLAKESALKSVADLRETKEEFDNLLWFKKKELLTLAEEANNKAREAKLALEEEVQKKIN